MAVLLRRGFKTWCENAARGYRRELEIDLNGRLDPRLLAEHLGITIWTPFDVPGLDRRDAQHLTVTGRDEWSAATLRSGLANLIIVNTGHSLERQNNSLAHEIGNIVLEHAPAKMYLTDDGLMMMSEYNPVHEGEANCFAGAVLVPRDALLTLIRRGMNDGEAGTYFGVSPELIQMRRNMTGVDIQESRRRGTWAP